MDKRKIFHLVDEIWQSPSCNLYEKADNLHDIWNQLTLETEKKYFINRVFKRFGRFPECIYNSEYLLEQLKEPNSANLIFIASQQKNKPITKFK